MIVIKIELDRYCHLLIFFVTMNLLFVVPYFRNVNKDCEDYQHYKDSVLTFC